MPRWGCGTGESVSGAGRTTWARCWTGSLVVTTWRSRWGCYRPREPARLSRGASTLAGGFETVRVLHPRLVLCDHIQEPSWLGSERSLERLRRGPRYRSGHSQQESALEHHVRKPPASSVSTELIPWSRGSP